MKYYPHNYQSYATDFIIGHPICFLMLGCGLGKTVISLSALELMLYDYFNTNKILVVAPKRVAESVWRGELKWDHLRDIKMSLIIGSAMEREAALNEDADVYVIGRDNLAWLVSRHDFDFDMVILDEASSFKNPKSQRFKPLKKVRPKIKRIVALSATPASNSLMDLWPQMYLLDMGERLGRYIGGYREQYFLPDKRNRDIIYSYKLREGAEKKIFDAISDITISMKAEDYLDMPDFIPAVHEVSMNAKEQKAYEELKTEMVLTVGEDTLDAVNAAALSNKLLQLASGSVYGDDGKVIKIHDRKLDMLEDIIEASNGNPVLIAYWFRHERDRIMERFDAREINTAKDIADWNEGKIPIAILHPMSGGHGLNLQGTSGSSIIWFSLPNFSLELYTQFNARLYRQGRTGAVVVHHIITKETIDEDVMKAIEKKDAGQTALIDAVRARIGG